MLATRAFVALLAVGFIALGPNLVFGQNYPSKPIRIVTQQIGGTSDVLARIIGQGISGPLGQPVIVDNQLPVISHETVAKAPPDGYIVLYGGSGFMFGPLLQKASWDAINSSPITITAKAPAVLAVHPSLPLKSVKELIALAKARPGELNYGSGTTGGSGHLAAELFKSMAGVNIVRVPYAQSAALLSDLLSGEIQLTFIDPATVLPLVKSGKLRALAITSAEPSILYPGLSTVAAAGLPGYEMANIHAMWAPPGTPTVIVNRLNQEIVRVLNSADVKEKFSNTGVEAASSSPEQAAIRIKADIAKIANLIKDAGIKRD